MSEFKREDRYLVLKRSDIAKYLGEDDLLELEAMAEEIANRRMDDGRSREMYCVVVEHDWPNYVHVWQTVQQVAEGTFKDPSAEIKRLRKGYELAIDERAGKLREIGKNRDQLKDRLTELYLLLDEHFVEWEKDSGKWDESDWHNRVSIALAEGGANLTAHNQRIVELAITPEAVKETMQIVWDEHTTDTQCFPPDFHLGDDGLLYFKAGGFAENFAAQLLGRALATIEN
ncbi:hypothetical protein [Marinobacterium lutimaris]|uniref:Uncharacterized protein n=1 Tax=Marinobacterium lutimaris TaxID=568106 RepID=A0A1H5XXF8_9GAMM|nr:hypothetical protein [Marinobacterium lutimaris]SEG16348.1 hypothetical protein SAMN05444390_1011537 [Marinobacterium lutimaris]